MTSLLSFKLAYRQVRARVGQVALSVVAVALGVGLVVAIQLMNGAVLASFLETADGVAGRASLTISPGPGLLFPEAMADKVAAVPGVALAVPLVRAVAFPDDSSGELLTVHGVDLTRDAAVRLYHSAGAGEEVIADLVEFLNQPDSIVLGREFAERRGLRLGDEIRLVTPYGVKPFHIRGLLDPEGLARTLGGRLVVMDLFAAERAFAADGEVSQIDVVVDKGADVDAVRQAIAAVVPPGLQVEEPALRKTVVRRTIGGFQFMVSAFGLLAVLAGFVICYSRLNAVFEARTWQVGLLRAVGLSRTAVFAELLKESLLLALVGTVLGIGIGWVIGRFGLPVLATTTALAFRMPVPATEVPGLRADAVEAGIGVGLAAALLAAVMPALRLARKQPVAALRLRGREMQPTQLRLSWLLRPLILVGLIGLTIAAQEHWQQAAFGHVTTALLALGVLVTATPAVALGGRAIGSIWAKLFGPIGRFAARHVEWQPRRSALTVATIGLGLGAVLLFAILSWSFERTIVAQLGYRMRADYFVTSANSIGGYVPASLADGVLEELRQVPGVHSAFGDQYRDIRYKDESVILIALDPQCFLDKRVCGWNLLSGADEELTRVARGEGALISRTFAHGHAVKVGDEISLPSDRKPVSLRVLGVTDSEPTDSVILSRDFYKAQWNDPFIKYADTMLQDGADGDRVQASIRSQLGQKYGLTIFSRSEFLDYFAGQVRQAFSLAYIMEGMTLLLLAVALGDTLAAGVAERTRRFATLRALGMPRTNLFQLVLLEGATIGILGLGLAAVVGLALGLFWVSIQFPALLGWRLDVHFPYGFALGAAALTLLLCVVGSLLPSRRAARLVVARALRND